MSGTHHQPARKKRGALLNLALPDEGKFSLMETGRPDANPSAPMRHFSIWGVFSRTFSQETHMFFCKFPGSKRLEFPYGLIFFKCMHFNVDQPSIVWTKEIHGILLVRVVMSS